MIPMVFCASFMPCETPIAAAETSCALPKKKFTNGVRPNRRSQPLRLPNQANSASKAPITTMPSTKPATGDATIGTSTFGINPPPRHQWFGSVAQMIAWKLPSEAANAAPHKPPISACDDDEGKPNHHVIRFQMIAPSSAQISTSPPTCSTPASIRPVAIVIATAEPSNAPPRLVAAASNTAWPGVKTLVATTVAMELAVSWKPLMYVNANAITMTAVRRPRLMQRPVSRRQDHLRIFQLRFPAPSSEGGSGCSRSERPRGLWRHARTARSRSLSRVLQHRFPAPLSEGGGGCSRSERPRGLWRHPRTARSRSLSRVLQHDRINHVAHVAATVDGLFQQLEQVLRKHRPDRGVAAEILGAVRVQQQPVGFRFDRLQAILQLAHAADVHAVAQLAHHLDHRFGRTHQQARARSEIDAFHALGHDHVALGELLDGLGDAVQRRGHRFDVLAVQRSHEGVDQRLADLRRQLLLAAPRGAETVQQHRFAMRLQQALQGLGAVAGRAGAGFQQGIEPIPLPEHGLQRKHGDRSVC